MTPAASSLPPASDLKRQEAYLLTQGRLLLAAAQISTGALLLALTPLSRAAVWTLALLFVYNLASLLLLRRQRVFSQDRLLILLLALDLFSVGAAAWVTGASSSPFLGQCFLLIFAAALRWGARGGLILGAASVVLTMILAAVHPQGLWADLRDLLPYFLIAGLFTGTISDRGRRWFGEYIESREREQERAAQIAGARRELDEARRVQQATLQAGQAGPSGHLQIPGLEIALRAFPAQVVGGDFHLILPADPPEAGAIIVIGDVSGKGTSAALTATSICHLLPWLSVAHDPGEALRLLNQDLYERLPPEMFVTLAIARIDTWRGRVHYWSAGHPLALHQRGAAVRETPPEYNLPLGMVPDWNGQPAALTLEPNETLVLYTDGLIEARQKTTGACLGVERCAEIVAKSDSTSVDTLAQQLLDTAFAWSATETLADDLTLIVCRRTHGVTHALTVGSAAQSSRRSTHHRK